MVTAGAGIRALSEQFKAAVGPNGVDLIYDGVGGDITVDTKPGQGAAFHVRLPLAASVESAT